MKNINPVILGAAAVTSAIGTAILSANGVFKEHTWIAWCLYGLAVVLFAWALANSLSNARTETDKSAPGSPLIHQTQSVRQEANPQIFIGREYLPHQPQQSPVPAPLRPKQPNIHFVEAKSVRAHVGAGDRLIYESPEGLGDFPVAIVCFRNEAIVGQSLQEPKIKTHIVYKDKNGEEITDAPRGVWLGLYGEATVFETGKKRCLIVLLLGSQGTLRKIWNESYNTRQSWMAGGPGFRIRDAEISGDVASIEVNLLVRDECLLRQVFNVSSGDHSQLPNLVLSPAHVRPAQVSADYE